MKIGFCIQKIAQISGGAEKVLVDVANFFAAQGHEIQIICYENYGEAPFFALHPDIQHLNIKPFDQRRADRSRRLAYRDGNPSELRRERRNEILGRLPFLADFVWNAENKHFIKRLSGYMEWHKPDIVVAFLPGIGPQCMEARKKSSHKPKILFSLHNSPWADFADPTKWSRNRKDRRLRRAAVMDADLTTVLLDSYKTFFSAKEQKNLSVQANFIPDDQGIPYKDREKVFLSVGRLTNTKNHVQLIKAFAAIKDQIPDWRVEIFGKGVLEAELEDLITTLDVADQVFLMGHTSKIGEQYAKASVFVLPSWNEGFPLVMGEAFTYRLPALGFSDCTGVNFLIKDDENGILLPERSTEDLSNALLALATDDALRQRLSDGARSFIDKGEYSYDNVMEIWTEKLESL